MSKKFPLGQIVFTPGVQGSIDFVHILSCLKKHVVGDWGDCCKEDARTNDQALINGSRIFSAYHDEDGTKFWIITEADRSSTCILLPEEY